MTYDNATSSDKCLLSETKASPSAGQTNVNNNPINNNLDEANSTSSHDHYEQDSEAQTDEIHQPGQNNHLKSKDLRRITSSTSSDNSSSASGGSNDTSETVNQIESEDGEIVACGSDNEAGQGPSSTTLSEQNNCEQNEKVRIKSPPVNDDGSSPVSSCYNQVLDDEIRARLDKLNALSDLINSLERQSDEANGLFRETLKCSTERLSSIAKTLGTKSIRHGRVYHAAKLSVEQSQSDCQRACVQFERANNDHHLARQAIREAELKLKSIAGGSSNDLKANNGMSMDNDDDDDDDNRQLTQDFSSKLKLQQNSTTDSERNISKTECDKDSLAFIGNNNDDDDVHKLAATHSLVKSTSTTLAPQSQHADEMSFEKEQIISHCHQTTNTTIKTQPEEIKIVSKNAQETNDTDDDGEDGSLQHNRDVATMAAKLGEELNLATRRLREAEELRCQSERQHLNEASKLMVAQENLLKLERQYGQSIKRSQLYFEEAKRFNARLNSVKSDINRIGDEILAAKQAYALTLSELEQFSEDLHEASSLVG